MPELGFGIVGASVKKTAECLHNLRLQFDRPRIELLHRQRFRGVDPLPKSLETKRSSAAAVSLYAR